MEYVKLESVQPRYLRYRSHYKVYFAFLIFVATLLFALWGVRFALGSFQGVIDGYPVEIVISIAYFIALPFIYYLWLEPRINHSVQVFPTHLLHHKGKNKVEVNFEQIESVTIVGWSLFYLKMVNGHKHYFNSDLERTDYIWEGVFAARPDLIKVEDFERFRANLVQIDHHQKRKEWFFRHKLIDIVTWIMLPIVFLIAAYFVQSQYVVIHQQSLYFFRLLMYSLLILLVTSFTYSLFLKKFIFDKKFQEQNEVEGLVKVRDLEFEGVIIHRSKMFQLVTSALLLAIVVKADINFYSVSKTKVDLSRFKIPVGKTLIVDNRYNCINCKYGIVDGDLVMFGKGIVGQVFAKAGEPIGEVVEDKKGRTIASLNVQEVPEGYLAVKMSNGKDVKFVRIVDLIGKIQK